jgi:Fe-S cluster assembly protein SufD
MEAVARPNDLYSASLARFEEKRFADEPAWLSKIRGEAFARFMSLGFPSMKNEEWKYTNVGPIAKVPFRPANEETGLGEGHAGPSSARASEGRPLPGGDGARIVFVNGRHASGLSNAGAGTAIVRSLREALREEPRLLEPHLARHASFERNAFTALNTAFLEDGAFVRIPRGTIAGEPVHLIFLSAADSREPAVSHPRNLILAESNSQATIIETHIGSGALPEGEGVYFTNAVTEVVCEEGAVLEHYKVQRESLSAFHVQTIQADQGRTSNFTSHNLCLGAALARTDINVLFTAEGSECALNGLFLAGGTQHMDNHTTIDHSKPRCTSRELYKGILDGRSRGVFHGKIIVRPDAQKTDAVQTNKNLLLSREALVNSTPALEILADDVKCRHGSTIGQLDANSLFYLRSRGIGEREARALLTYGFAADLANRIRVPWVREEIEAFLGLRLPQSVCVS